MSATRLPARAALLRLGALSLLVAALGACSDDRALTGPRVTADPTASGGAGLAPPDRAAVCDEYLNVARTYANASGVQRFCYTPELRPMVWDDAVLDPPFHSCTCRGTAAAR